jgi:nitroreductase
MDCFEAIKKRHCYRGEFEASAIPREDLERIVDAGIRAPSGCNAQTTRFVIVDDPEKLAAIATLVDRPFMRTAQAMIVCVAEYRAVYGEFSFGVEDCAASVENMLLSITASGYASVWLDGLLRRDGVAEKIATLLGVPKDLDVRVMLPVGVPKEELPQKERLPFKERAWFNQWQAEG